MVHGGGYDAADWERLPGNVGGALRIGTTVHRVTGPWTPAVHALLVFLATRLEHVPRLLGFDEAGREVLSYLPGRVIDIDSELPTDGQIAAAARWTRAFHRAVVDFRHPGPWRYPEMPDATLIGHNDIAPYNVCFDGDELVGVFDWDLAGPSTVEMELAFMAWNFIPLWRDVGAEWAAQRLEVLCRSYGGLAPADVLAAVPRRIQRMLDWIPAAASAGDPGLINLMRQGEPQRSQQALDDLVTRVPAIRRWL